MSILIKGLKKCTVSFPIKWDDLYKIKPDEITIESALKYLKEKYNPWKDFFKK